MTSGIAGPIWISGGASPLGQRVAAFLSRREARVVAVDLEGTGSAPPTSPREFPVEEVRWPSDVAEPSDPWRSDSGGVPAALVHVLPPPPPEEGSGTVSVATLRRRMDRELLLPVILAHRAMPRWRESGGRLVWLGSPASRCPEAFEPVHAAFAGALRGFAIALDREMRRSGVAAFYLEAPLVPGALEGQGRSPDGSSPEILRLLREVQRCLERPPARPNRGGAPRTIPRGTFPRTLKEERPSQGLSPSLALVTGASRGIGRSIALSLAERGWDLWLGGRDEVALEGVAREVRHFGRQAEVHAGDLSQEHDLRELLEAVRGSPQTPALLVLNAGLGYARRFERTPLSQVLEQIRVNLFSPLTLSLGVLPRLQNAAEGGLVLMGSASAGVPVPRLVTYSSTKAGVRALGRSLAARGRMGGLRVLTVEPITVRTDFLARARGGAPVSGRRPLWERVQLTPQRVARETLRALDQGVEWLPIPSSVRYVEGVLRALGPLGERLLRIPPPRRGFPSGSPS
jgi:short-subunit dehydrogenase